MWEQELDFHGIPIKIYNKSTQVTLLDSLKKRTTFLDEVIKELDLEGIETIHGRAEDIARDGNYREKFDIATARAVSNLRTLVEYLLPFVKINGQCICMKGANAENEINESKNAIKLLGGKIEKIEEFTLPKTDMKRTIILIKKVKPTEKKYPRKAGTPVKKPL